MHAGNLATSLTCTFGVVLSSLPATQANVSGGTAEVVTGSNTPCSSRLLSGALTDTISVPFGRVRQLNFASSCMHRADGGTAVAQMQGWHLSSRFSYLQVQPLHKPVLVPAAIKHIQPAKCNRSCGLVLVLLGRAS
jgi:hypothetical protein